MRRRVAWMHLTQNSQVIGVEGNTLVLGDVDEAGGRRVRDGRDDHEVAQPAQQVLGEPAWVLAGLDHPVDHLEHGGAGAEGVTHVLATGLLGYTPDSLLDDVVDAFAAADGAAVFGVVDRVIETGQDPRRFAEDLLRRLRDLVIVAAVPDAPATGLIDVSVDQGERLVAQSARFGGAELSRAADLVAAGLTEMRGATAPRLLLELICARVLLPGADHGTDGLMARIDRLEKRAAISGGAPSQTTVSTPPPPPVGHPVERVAEASAPPVPRPDPTPAAPEAPVEVPRHQSPTPAAPRQEAAPVAPTAPAEPTEAAPAGGLTLVEVRRLWPDIVEATKLRRRVAWMHLTQNSQVIGVEGNTLVLGFNNAGARDSFVNGGCDEILRQAAIDVVGMDWKVDAIVDPGARPDTATSAPPATGQPGSTAAEAPAATTSAGADEEAPAPEAGQGSPTPERPAAPKPTSRPADPSAVAAARGAISRTREGEPPEDPRARDADAHPDDPDDDASGVDTTELLQRELGAQVIEETRNQ